MAISMKKRNATEKEKSQKMFFAKLIG